MSPLNILISDLHQNFPKTDFSLTIFFICHPQTKKIFYIGRWFSWDHHIGEYHLRIYKIIFVLRGLGKKIVNEISVLGYFWCKTEIKMFKGDIYGNLAKIDLNGNPH